CKKRLRGILMEYLEDKDIIELFIARDERAITETIRKYNSRLHGRVMYILNNIEDAEECLQDTYFTLWEKVAEEKPGHLENYIFTIAKFIACNKLRKRLAKKRYVPLTVIGEDYPSSSDVFSEISSYELEKYILDFIKMQKNEVQMIIYLDYEKKLSLHEIADVMGETEGAVKMKLYRFRKKLKQYLINEGFV
uniref:RNA polymerase sigma factor n=2 Tax=Eshraghiella crossota TaxID=45851 RepID=UPI004026897C